MVDKPFSVVIAVYGAAPFLELTLRTLLAVGKNYVDAVFLVDSSYRLMEPPFQETVQFIYKFADEEPNVHVVQSKRHPHGIKLDIGVRKSNTPYTFLLDSDVEFKDGSLFPLVQQEFEANEKLFAIGHGDPSIQLGHKYIEAENMYLGGLFVKTEVAKHYVNSGVSFYRKDCMERRPEGRTRVFYDTSSYLTKIAQEQGHECQKLEMLNKFYTHTKHRSWPQVQLNEEEDKPEIRQKLNDKIWEKLIQTDSI